MRRKHWFATILLLLFACGLSSTRGQEKQDLHSANQDWTNYVRIGAYGLKGGDGQQIADKASASGVFGIEVDNDIPGRYESFLDPTAKLKAIHDVAEAAHKAGNYAFVYIAGTECITAHADQTPHTLFKDHPDWLQRNISGTPAIFGGGSAFWIRKGDEDVWVSPYAPEWRKTYMERVRQIAGTGIDGIYVDIPYWMTHFDGWENTWASFDDYTVAAFKQQTGLDAKHDLKLGDFSDPAFRKWVTFRIQTFTDFMAEIDRTAKSVNPKIKTIPEIYPGIEQEAVRVGADVYSLYAVTDAIAHEYEFGEGDHMASSRKPLDWFRYQVGMHSFRAFAQGKATWILNYSWDGDKNVDAREAMKNLAMSQVMAGANFWDAPGHSMAGSNDLPTRKEIFSWIQAHEKTFYLPRSPIDPIGVYFSPETRNFYAQDFLASYRGILILLMQKHLEFQIVTPRTLADFRGETLVLPDVRVLGESEKAWLQDFRRLRKKTGGYGDGCFRRQRAKHPPLSRVSREGLQHGDRKRFRTRVLGAAAGVSRRLTGWKCGEDQGRGAGGDVSGSDFRRTRERLLRKLQRAEGRIESGADTGDWRGSDGEFQDRGQGILLAVSGRGAVGEGDASRRCGKFRVAADWQGWGVLV